MSKIGLVTLGQAPRGDLIVHTGLRTQIVQRGALNFVQDENTLESVMWKPSDIDLPLSTQYDGSDIIVGRRRLLRFLQKAIDYVEGQGVDVISVLCTESFPELRSSVPVVRVDRLIQRELVQVARGREAFSVCVFVPTVGQVVPIETRWNLYVSSRAFHLDPGASDDEVRQACAKACKSGASFDYALLDCMGYGDSMKQLVEAEMSCNAIVPPQLLGAYLTNLDSVRHGAG